MARAVIFSEFEIFDVRFGTSIPKRHKNHHPERRWCSHRIAEKMVITNRPNPTYPNFGSSSDFGHLMLRKALLTFKKIIKKRKITKYWGDYLLRPQDWGTRTPRPPGAAPGDVQNLIQEFFNIF